MALVNDDPSTSGERDPHALYKAYQTSTDPVHRRQLLRAILDCGPPADGAEIWLLLREARALVGELCSSTEAEQLLLDHARNGGFPHYRGLTTGTQQSKAGGTRPTPLINPRHWGDSGLSTRCPVDWDESCVSYVRLEVSPASQEEAVLEELQDYLPAEPFFQTRLVRLPLFDVLVMLDRHGLLPEPPTSLPKPAPLSLTPLKPAGSLSAATSEVAGASPLPTTKWVVHAITECREELAGLSDRAVCKQLEVWMRDGKTGLRPAQKPVGWSRIKTIATEQGLLPIKSAGN